MNSNFKNFSSNLYTVWHRMWHHKVWQNYLCCRLQCNLLHSWNIPKSFTFLSFFLTYSLTSLKLPVFWFRYFNTSSGHQRAFSSLYPLSEYHLPLIRPYTILRATEECSFIFASSICSFIENPDSTQAFSCDKISIKW